MDPYLLVLRLAHIIGGILWVGAAWMLIGFVTPAAASLGPTSGRFFEALMRRRRLSAAIAISSILTVVSGILLYLRDSGGLQPSWITSPVGLGFTIGGLAGIAALVVGAALIGPTSDKMMAAGQALATAGGPPSAEAMAELEGYRRRLNTVTMVNFVLLTIAVIFMAIARYLG